MGSAPTPNLPVCIGFPSCAWDPYPPGRGLGVLVLANPSQSAHPPTNGEKCPQNKEIYSRGRKIENDFRCTIFFVPLPPPPPPQPLCATRFRGHCRRQYVYRALLFVVVHPSPEEIALANPPPPPGANT